MIPLPAMAEPVCVQAAVVPGFERWAKAAAGPLQVGAPATIALRPTGEVRLASGRAPVAGTHAAAVPLTIARAGTYRIALGAAGWIDVVGDGVALPSVAHAHGPACSGIRKIVSYRLAPGRYQLQLSEVGDTTIRVMVAGEQ